MFSLHLPGTPAHRTKGKLSAAENEQREILASAEIGITYVLSDAVLMKTYVLMVGVMLSRHRMVFKRTEVKVERLGSTREKHVA